MIEVNGEYYEEYELPKSRIGGKYLSLFMLPEILFQSVSDGLSKESNPIEGVDIVKEFELIQQKKSSLSASKRKMVQAAFKRRYKLVEISKNK